MPYPTLLDIAVQNGSDAVVGLIDEAVRAHPELERGAARTISGLNYKTLVRTANPTVSFRNANEGVEAQKAVYENRLVETFILNLRFEADRAVADRHEDGWQAYLANEASAQVEAAAMLLCRQFYYGTAVDAKGFPGLADMVLPSMSIDAGGTTPNAGSSVWAVRFGPRDVQWVWGNGGALELSEVRVESITTASDRRFTAYVQELLAYPGLQVGSVYSVGRIYNLTAQAGNTLTDARIASLLSLFPVGFMPDALFMSRRSLEQLRASRTATNATGAPAPFPTEAFGVPVFATDAISDTEAII